MTILLSPVDPETGTAADKHFHIILVEPEIPPNTGTTARLCAGTNTYLHIVKPMVFDLDDSKLKRAGLDYWPNVHLTVHEDFEAILKIFPPERLHLFTTKTSKSYSQSTFSLGDALVFGSETRGLPEAIRSRFEDRCVTLPIVKNNIRSLNLATSAAIALYEALRQVDFAPINT